MCCIYIVCGGRSCSEDNDRSETATLAATKDSIRHSFEIEAPGSRQLLAYETSAKQKLTDFADYLKIVSDTTLDIRFRKQAAGMALNMFVSKTCNTGSWNRLIQSDNIQTLQQLLDKSLEKGMTGWIQPCQIEITTPLVRENDSSFKGNLTFSARLFVFQNPEQTINLPKKVETEIFVLRKIKEIGKERLNIWEVSLGNMN